MTSNDLFQPGATYTFETLAPAILGSKIERAVCEGVFTYRMALISGFPGVGDRYRQIYPTLPAGTPDIPESLRYYVFSANSGGRVIVCEQWVNEDTVELIDYIDIAIRLTRKSPSDAARISQLLRGAGYADATVTVTKS